MIEKIKKSIESGEIALGIELGSTRIKGILVDNNFNIVAQGDYLWENSLVDGIWTYSLDEIWKGVQSCYKSLKLDVKEKYGVTLKKINNMGFSAMMHGYIVLDKEDNMLVPFRTWRNTQQEEASHFLGELYNYPVPQRFSNSHIYQAILNDEQHINDIAFQTTLAGFVHYKLTGEKVLGVGEASGVFPIDLETKSFNMDYIERFNKVIADRGVTWKYQDILPKVLVAGENAGTLTLAGANLLDVDGDLESGSVLCAPEGDAGTGMVATNSVSKKTGNVSAGTSVFAMIVLEDNLKKVHNEIDLVTTPDGNLVGMVHCNNCTSNLNTWVDMFDEVINTFGFNVSKNELYTKLYKKALESDLDAGGVLSYGYVSGEHITKFEEGRPLIVSKPDSNFNLANFMRSSLYTSLGALKIGLDILLKEEEVKLDKIYGHGGFFKTEEVGQRIMSQATNAPVSIMENAGEGGAWGMSILAMYQNYNDMELPEFLNAKIFKDNKEVTISATEEEVKGFELFMDRYKKGLEIERSAIENLL